MDPEKSIQQSFSGLNESSLAFDTNPAFENRKFSDESGVKLSQNDPAYNNFVCEICGKSYSHKRSLKYHMKKNHLSHTASIVSPQKVSKSFNFCCECCGKNFSKKYLYMSHKRLEHISEGCKQGKLISCAYCNSPIEKKSFAQHLLLMHDKTLQTDSLQFTSFNNFIEWKEEIENTSNSRFVLERGAKISGTNKIYYYSCHRSGFYNSKGKGLRQGSSYDRFFRNAKVNFRMRKKS